MQTLIYNVSLILPDRMIEGGWLLIEDEKIAGLGESAICPKNGPQKQIDGHGSFLMPGMIDLHCDGIERLVEPRPNVTIDIHLALDEIDRRLAGCGITTEFHAISLDDHEFGTRAVSFAQTLSQAIHDNLPHSLVRHEVHARLELTSQNGFETIQHMIQNREVRLVSLMDHSPGQGQYKSEDAFRGYVKRTVNMSDAEIDALLLHKRTQQSYKPERTLAVTKMVREAGMALATHDDDDPAKIAEWPALGVTMSEFPTTWEAAHKAHEIGLAVCMGAPNVLRGKSSGGNISATDIVRAGICDVLCSDYYPSAMLAAIFKLVSQDILGLPQAVRLVTLNAAKAVQMDTEFGSLEAGKVADLILVELNSQHQPKVQRLFLAGNEHLTVRSKHQ